MGTVGGPNIVTDGLVLYLDAGNYNSFEQGEPTVNLNREYYNFTGTSYALGNEWSSTTLIKEWDPNIITPIGNGATLITESTTSGWQALSRMGGGGENFLHSISAYVYPVSCSEMQIGMLNDGGHRVTFNFNNQTIFYNSLTNNIGIFEEVRGYPGWYRIGGNIEGRFGGWVGVLGFNVFADAAPTAEEAQSAYVTGLQYEYKPYPTPFVAGTRAIWDNIVGNNNGTLVNSPSFNRDGIKTHFEFDGTNDVTTFELLPFISSGSSYSVCLFINPTEATTEKGVWLNTNTSTDRHGGKVRDGVFVFKAQDICLSSTIDINKWQYICCVWDGTNAYLYVDGVENSTDVSDNGSYRYFGYDTNIGKLGSSNTNVGNTYFNGKISSFQTYNKALSPQEVLQNYKSTKSRFNL